jgi:hypothetical protein
LFAAETLWESRTVLQLTLVMATVNAANRQILATTGGWLAALGAYATGFLFLVLSLAGLRFGARGVRVGWRTGEPVVLSEVVAGGAGYWAFHGQGILWGIGGAVAAAWLWRPLVLVGGLAVVLAVGSGSRLRQAGMGRSKRST